MIIPMYKCRACGELVEGKRLADGQVRDAESLARMGNQFGSDSAPTPGRIITHHCHGGEVPKGITSIIGVCDLAKYVVTAD